MAQKVLTILTDDLDGKELAPGEGRTVRFAFDGVEYELDLSDKNVNKIRRDFDPYILAARKVGSSRGRGRSASKGNPGEMAAIRLWAVNNGFEVSSRGRIPENIKEAYAAAN